MKIWAIMKVMRKRWLRKWGPSLVKQWRSCSVSLLHSDKIPEWALANRCSNRLLYTVFANKYWKVWYIGTGLFLFQYKRIILITLTSDIMYRYVFRFAVMTITILTANLLTTAIGNYLVIYKNHYRPAVFTLLGMAVTVVILYPLFVKLEGWVKVISVKAINSGRSLAGKYLGLVLTFLAAFLLLFNFYARMWYHIDLFQILRFH